MVTTVKSWNAADPEPKLGPCLGLCCPPKSYLTPQLPAGKTFWNLWIQQTTKFYQLEAKDVGQKLRDFLPCCKLPIPSELPPKHSQTPRFMSSFYPITK